MEMKVHTAIEQAVLKRKAGDIIFPTDFRGKGTQTAIRQALSRLVRGGKLKRLAHGIYYIPKFDAALGPVKPDPEEVVKLVAQKERIHIRPTGAWALHRLGLTTQVPTKRVYITDGNPRQFNLGKVHIHFKATSAKKLAMKGQFSGLVIQAIEELGTDQVSMDIEVKLRKFLLEEEPKKLQHDLQLASGRVHDYIIKLLKNTSAYDRMVKAHA